MHHEMAAANRQAVASQEREIVGKQRDLRKRFRLGETAIQAVLFLCGAFSILTTIGSGSQVDRVIRNARTACSRLFCFLLP